MAPPHTAEAWQRVGQMLKQRRGGLNPRYRIRRIFANERGITDKTAQEIENAPKYRTTFSPELIAAIEAAYGIAPGSIDKALTDPDLTEFPDRIGSATIEIAAPGQEGQPRLSAVPDMELGAPGDPDPRDPVTGLDGLRNIDEVQVWTMTRLGWRLRVKLIETLREDDEDRPAEQRRTGRRADNGAER